jgi:succinoglycan biosynthesis transport protein ExoP
MRRQYPSKAAEAIPAGSAESELDLGALGRALWARKFAILTVTVAAAVLSFAAVSMITPRYKSEARVIIENRETPYNQAQGDRTPERDRTLLDAEAVQSQVQLALSRDLARSIIREMKFAERPEFNPNAGGSVVDSLLGIFGLSRGRAPMSDEDRILERYFERLTVYQVDRSGICGARRERSRGRLYQAPAAGEAGRDQAGGAVALRRNRASASARCGSGIEGRGIPHQVEPLCRPEQ